MYQTQSGVIREHKRLEREHSTVFLFLQGITTGASYLAFVTRALGFPKRTIIIF
jgi:hypothetical protein